MRPSRGPGPRSADRYRPEPMAMTTTPPTTSMSWPGTPLAAGIVARPTFVAVPMSATLRSVPMPGRSPSGHQRAMMGSPSATLTVPSGTPTRPPSPWWKASQGPSPRPDWAMSAIPIPNVTSPARRPGSRGRTAAGRQRSRIRRW